MSRSPRHRKRPVAGGSCCPDVGVQCCSPPPPGDETIKEAVRQSYANLITRPRPGSCCGPDCGAPIVKKPPCTLVRVLLFLCVAFPALPASHGQELALPAFPGAEGFGAFTPGGRGGKVCLVTTLADYDPNDEPAVRGSLREAVEMSGPRIIVFRVAGNIKLNAALVVSNPYVTIAGQTAPGDGICLTTYTVVIATHDVIVRYVRMRLGDEVGAESGTLDIYDGQNVIVDHCSVSWSIDEVLSVTRPETRNVTVQWCIIAEGLNRSFHPKGEHGHGSLLRSFDGGMTFHHNVYAHNHSRNPRPGSYPDAPGLILDFRNNVIYDWGQNAGYSGEHRLRLNYVNNYLRPGRSTRETQRRYAFSVGGIKTSVFLAGNRLRGFPEADEDNWRMMRPSGDMREMGGWGDELEAAVGREQPFPAPPIALQSAEEAYGSILPHVGATLPARDAADRRLMREIRTGRGRIIDSQEDVGGWPRLRTAAPAKDADLDGMPDRWERRHNLDAQDAADSSADADGDGYTNIEEYLNDTDPRARDDVEPTFRLADILAQIDTLNVQARRQIESEKREAAARASDASTLARESLRVAVEPDPAGLPKSLTVTIGDGVEMPMRLIPAGTFMMGSPETEEGRDPDETLHEVTISRPFYVGAGVVTRGQFAAVFGRPVDDEEDERSLPMRRVTWFEAVDFCSILSLRTGCTLRLPTEAEWEYACRAGTQTPFNTGSTISTEQANFNGTYVYGDGERGIYRRKETPAGTFPPNAWGLFGMHGNLFEWCSDWYGEYPEGPVIDPTGPETGGSRVIRGGAYGSHPAYIRSASRYSYRPSVWFGFRVAMEAPSGTPKVTTPL